MKLNKSLLSASLLSLILFSSACSSEPALNVDHSEEIMTCHDLAEAISLIEIYSDIVFLEDRVRAGSELDDDLDTLTSIIEQIANSERDKKLIELSEDLSIAWSIQAWTDFSLILDDISIRLDRIGRRDCD